MYGYGGVSCWGDNQYEQAEAYENTATGTLYRSVSAGGRHSCALSESGEPACWGFADYGQADAPSGEYRSISAGKYHTCALRETGEVVCWGGRHFAMRIPADMR